MNVPMARNRCRKQTHHAMIRVKERMGLPKREADRFLRNASKNGKSVDKFPEGTPFREYLETKCVGKRVKVYGNWIIIFNKNSDRAITVYPIPVEYMEEYKSYASK